MLAVAVIGLLANGASLVVLRDAQRESLAMRGAYLEVMGDLVGSVAVIVALAEFIDYVQAQSGQGELRLGRRRARSRT